MSTSFLSIVVPQLSEQQIAEFSGDINVLALTFHVPPLMADPAIQEETGDVLCYWIGWPKMNAPAPPVAAQHHPQTHDVAYFIYQGRNYQQCQNTINELRETAKERNWDGEDSKPISDEVILLALRVAANLPGDLPVPEIYPDPEGRIEFDWALENGTIFTLTVGPKGDAAMSAKRTNGGFLRGWAKNDDDDDTIPDFVAFSLNWLKRMAVK